MMLVYLCIARELLAIDLQIADHVKFIPPASFLYNELLAENNC